MDSSKRKKSCWGLAVSEAFSRHRRYIAVVVKKDEKKSGQLIIALCARWASTFPPERERGSSGGRAK